MERLPGFRDFYPDPVPHADLWSCAVRQHLFQTWRSAARAYAFQEYDGPPLEPLELFTLKSGDEIVGQLYNFQDKGGREVALRPEMTPTLARMIAAHQRHYSKPVKWFALPQLYRYERQQKGRLREHFQFNADIFGDASPGADAELISLLIDSLRALGLGSEDFVVRLSSRNAWEAFYQARGGDPGRAYQFFQVIDKLEREDPARSDELLAGFGTRLSEVQAFLSEAKPTAELEQILEHLKARNLQDYVRIDYQVIRGLAYYTGTVFEAFALKGQHRAIAGGGRYDNLVRLISGGKVDLPAIGFGMGDVVLTLLLQELQKLPAPSPSADLFFLVEEEALRPASLAAIQHLRDRGFAVDYPFSAAKGDKQFKRAIESGARATLRVERTAEGERFRIKRLADRAESVGTLEEVLAWLQNAGRPA